MERAQDNEAEAVRTTIVGGRPPGSGRNNVPVPRGIEVLVKKAAIDAEFRKLLLEQRGRAAAIIGLELDPAETAMLCAISREQLARIVENTAVPAELRSMFAGQVAAAMMAALGMGLASSPAQPVGAPADPPKPGSSAPQPPASQVVTSPPAVLQSVRVAGAVAQTNAVYPIAGLVSVPVESSVPNPPPTAVKGLQMDVPPPANYRQVEVIKGLRADMNLFTNAVASPTNVPSTNPPMPPTPTRGMQPDRPPQTTAATNQPSTNPPPPSSRVTPPFRPAMFAVMIQPAPPKPPASEPPSASPPER